MFGSMSVNKNEKQPILFKPSSTTVKDADNIKGTTRAKNVRDELFNMISYSDELVFFSTHRGALVAEELRTALVHAPLLSEQADKLETGRFDNE
jgi:hypothetical protein